MRFKTYLIHLSILISFCLLTLSCTNTTPTKSKLIHPSFDHVETNSKSTQGINTDTITLFSLMTAEMLYQYEQPFLSLEIYNQLLQNNKKPEIAYRAEQIALSLNEIEIAKKIHNEWKKIEPNPSHRQQIMNWKLSLANKDYPYVITNFRRIIEISEEEDARKMFLLITQLGTTNPDFAKKASKEIHKISLLYNDFQEAAIADAIFSTLDHNRKNALKALNKLYKLDNSLSDNSIITLAFLAKLEPDLLETFFKQFDIGVLSSPWMIIYINFLLEKHKIDLAYQLIQQELKRTPSAKLYSQAGYISALKREPTHITQAYFDNAYNNASIDKKNYIALQASVASSFSKSISTINKWAEKIEDPQLFFDKYILLGSIAAASQNWELVSNYLDKIDQLNQNRGIFFNNDNLIKLKINYLIQTESIEKIIPIISNIIKEYETNPNNKDILSFLYIARATLYLENNNDYVNAADDYAKNLALHPNDPFAINALGYTYLEITGKEKEALILLKKAYKLQPDAAEIIDSLGWAYAKNNQFEEAQKYLKNAYQKIQSNEVAAHLIHVFWNLGKKKEAYELLNKVLKLNPDDKILQEIIKINNIQIK